MTEKYGVTAAELLGHAHGLNNSNWGSWFLLWRYASDNGLLNADIEQGTNAAEQQRPVSNRSLKAALKVCEYAAKKI